MHNVFEVIMYEYALHKGDYDEPPKEGALKVKGHESIGLIWPYSDEYRIISYEGKTHNKYGLQAKVGDSYTDVVYYDDGYDDYGKLAPAHWKNLSDLCSWRPVELKRLCNAIHGKEDVVSEIETIRRIDKPG